VSLDKLVSVNYLGIPIPIMPIIIIVIIAITPKQPIRKTDAALFKLANVKKVVKSKGAAKKWL